MQILFPLEIKNTKEDNMTILDKIDRLLIDEGKMKSLALAIKTHAYKSIKGKSPQDTEKILDKMWIDFSKNDAETWNKLTPKDKKNLVHFFNQMQDAAKKAQKNN